MLRPIMSLLVSGITQRRPAVAKRRRSITSKVITRPGVLSVP
jgi:hypothetical protein